MSKDHQRHLFSLQSITYPSRFRVKKGSLHIHRAFLTAHFKKP